MISRKTRAACLLALLLLSGASAAQQQAAPVADVLSGDIVISEAQLEGETSAVARSLDAIYVTGRRLGPAAPVSEPRGHLVLEFESAEVNWSYVREREMGPNPLNPGESLAAVVMERGTGEDDFGPASVSIAYGSPDLDLLLVPLEGEVDQRSNARKGASTVEIMPADDGAWRAGAGTQTADASNSDVDEFVTHTVNLTAGHPVVRTGAVHWTGHGHVVLYVWEANVTMDPQDGDEVTYRSGRWWTDRVGDEVHPHGVTAEQHSRLVRLTLHNASYTWTHEMGAAYQTAEWFELETKGTVRFGASRGFLESDEFTYSVGEETFEIEGAVTQSIEPRADDGHLRTLVRAENARVDLPPTGRAPTEAGTEPPPAGEQDASGRVVAPVGEGGMVGVLAVVALLGIAVAGGAFVLRRHGWGFGLGDGPRLGPLERAEIALMDRDTERARALAGEVLENNDADLDAWLIYGASLLKERAYERTVRELEPVAERLGPDTGLAFVLTLAHAHVGDDDGVLRWGEIAAEVPSARSELLRDPVMASYLDREPFRRALQAQNEGVAYV